MSTLNNPLHDLKANIKAMQEEEFERVLASSGLTTKSFMLGAIVAGANAAVSLGTAALFGCTAGGVNNVIGLVGSSVVGGIITKTMDNPITAVQASACVGLFGSHAIARTAKHFRDEQEAVAEQFI